MADYLNDALGTKYGCTYRYIKGQLGEFGPLLDKAVNPRKAKDPMDMSGSDFYSVNAPFEPMIKIGDYIQLLTSYTYPTTSYALADGTEEITNEEIDFSKFKKVLSFKSAGSFKIVAIPKDQLFISKNLIDTSDYPDGIAYIGITATNATAYVAITKDNQNWVAYDTNSGTWKSVNINDEANRKSNMMSLSTLESLTNTEYSKYFNSLDYVGIAILMCIEPTIDSSTGEEVYDTSVNYTVTPIEINYVGDDDSATTPSTQYFNFIKTGYTKEGNPILVADRVIQNNISFATLNNNTYDYYCGNTLAPMSTEKYPMYMRLFKGNIDTEEDEWKKMILEADQQVLGGKSVDMVFNVNLGSMTNVMATGMDTDGTGGGATMILYRGGESNPDRRKNIAYNAANVSYGWRPVLEIDCTSFEATKKYPAPALPTVTSLSELTPGKCISCDYIRNGSNFTQFKNLGKASLGLLSDYKNQKSGSFYFICVGYLATGEKILIADRPIETGMSYYTLLNGINGSYGIPKEIAIDGNQFYLTLVDGSDITDETDYSVGRWNNVITNEFATSKSIDEIWHTDKTSAYTGCLSSKSYTQVLLRGMEDMEKHISRQKSVTYNTSTAMCVELAYRPMLLAPPQMTVENLRVSMYSGYEKNKDQNVFRIQCKVVDADNNAVDFALKDATEDKIISDYSGDTIRNVSVVSLAKVGAETTINVIIKNGDEDKVVSTFKVFREALYRLTVSRIFGEVYDGWNSDGVDTHTTVLAPTASNIKKVTVSGNNSYISISPVTKKVVFSEK